MSEINTSLCQYDIKSIFDFAKQCFKSIFNSNKFKKPLKSSISEEGGFLACVQTSPFPLLHTIWPYLQIKSDFTTWQASQSSFVCDHCSLRFIYFDAYTISINRSLSENEKHQKNGRRFAILRRRSADFVTKTTAS